MEWRSTEVEDGSFIFVPFVVEICYPSTNVFVSFFIWKFILLYCISSTSRKIDVVKIEHISDLMDLSYELMKRFRFVGIVSK